MQTIMEQILIKGHQKYKKNYKNYRNQVYLIKKQDERLRIYH